MTEVKFIIWLKKARKYYKEIKLSQIKNNKTVLELNNLKEEALKSQVYCVSGRLDSKDLKKTSPGGFMLQERICNEILNSITALSLHKKWSFLLRISTVSVTKSAVTSGFGQVTFTEEILN